MSQAIFGEKRIFFKHTHTAIQRISLGKKILCDTDFVKEKRKSKVIVKEKHKSIDFQRYFNKIGFIGLNFDGTSRKHNFYRPAEGFQTFKMH